MANAHSAAAPVPHMAIDFLGKKIKVETEDWDELKWGEHAHAFTVAHSSGAGVLDTIFALMNKAQADGIAFSEFRNGMLDEMKAKGWYGGAGHTEKEKKYINWRIGVIYDTNMRTAYAQAEYREQLQGAHLRPIWVYQSELVGKNRRQEHIALHGRAFRYDDSFWDTHYPPNGWGCECSVSTESEHSAEKGGIKVEDSKNISLPEIDPTWAYNVGREALAPNFAKYTNLKEHGVLGEVKKSYRASMDETKMSYGELKTFLDRMKNKEYDFNKGKSINYQIGNIDKNRQNAMRIDDSKIMATEERIRHAFREKGDATILDAYKQDAYHTLQEPDFIYEEKKSRNNEPERIFHFIKNSKDKKIINAVLKKREGCALKLTTIDLGTWKKLNTTDLKEVWHEKN